MLLLGCGAGAAAAAASPRLVANVAPPLGVGLPTLFSPGLYRRTGQRHRALGGGGEGGRGTGRGFVWPGPWWPSVRRALRLVFAGFFFAEGFGRTDVCMHASFSTVQAWRSLQAGRRSAPEHHPGLAAPQSDRLLRYRALLWTRRRTLLVAHCCAALLAAGCGSGGRCRGCAPEDRRLGRLVSRPGRLNRRGRFAARRGLGGALALPPPARIQTSSRLFHTVENTHPSVRPKPPAKNQRTRLGAPRTLGQAIADLSRRNPDLFRDLSRPIARWRCPVGKRSGEEKQVGEPTSHPSAQQQSSPFDTAPNGSARPHPSPSPPSMALSRWLRDLEICFWQATT